MVLFGLLAIISSADLAQSQLARANTLTLSLQGYLENASRVLQSIGLLSEVDDGNELLEHIQATYSAYGYFESIYMLDDQARVQIIDPPAPQYLDLDMSSQPYLNRSLQPDQVSISQPTRSILSGKPVVVMVLPLADQRLLVGELSLEQLQVDLGKSTIPGETLFIADQQGTLLAHPRPELVAEQLNYKDQQIVRRGLQGNVSMLCRFENSLSLCSATHIQWAGWVIVTLTPLSQALVPYAGALLSGLLLIVLFGRLILASLNREFMQQVARPLLRLSRGANALAAGDYPRGEQLIRIPADYLEVQTLSHDLHNMSRSVQARQTALRKSEERLELALIGGDLALWDWDLRTNHVTFNQRWTEILGYTKNETIPDVSNPLRIVHPEDEALTNQRLQDHLEGKTSYYESEHRLRKRDGSWIWILTRGKVVLRDKNGRALRITGTHQDISERKLAEEALHARQRYLTLLNEMTRAAIGADDFNRMLQTLADRMRDLFGTDACFISLWDETTQSCRCQATSGAPLVDCPVCNYWLDGRCLALAAMEARKVLVIQEPTRPNPPLMKFRTSAQLAHQSSTETTPGTGFESSPPSTADFPIDPLPGSQPVFQTLMALPMFTKDERLGAVLVACQKPRQFPADELAFSEQAAAQVALAIAKQHSLMAERQRAAQLERANTIITALARVAALIETMPDIEQLMQALGGELRKLNISCLVALKVPNQEALMIRYLSLDGASLQVLQGAMEQDLQSFRLLPQNFPPYQRVMAERQSYFSDDPADMIAQLLPGFSVDRLRSLGASLGLSQSARMFFLPLQVEEQVLGMLWLWGSDLLETDLPATSLFASQVAISLENTRLLRTTMEASERRLVLHQVSQQISANLDFEQLLEAIYQAATQLIPSEIFAITLLDEARNEIEGVYMVDRGERIPSMRFSFGQGLSSRIIAAGKSVRYNEPQEIQQQQALYMGDDQIPNSLLAVPMRQLNGKVFGMLSLQSYETWHFTAVDQEMAEMLAAYAAIAIDNARLFAEINLLATTDPLTGLFNRRKFFEDIEIEIDRARRLDQPTALLILDIDDFKHINDTYGHASGDMVLQEISLRLKENIRVGDLLARYGGEEFIVLLVETTPPMALVVADRLRSCIAGRLFQIDAQVLVPVTVSAGIAFFDETCKDTSRLLVHADQALYAAKQAGKDQVRLWAC